MASQRKNFVSFVALGAPNPQILNIDFLRNNRVLPLDQEPFASLSTQEKLVKKFVSVPGFANLVLDSIEFIVDERRFQIVEKELSAWNETKVLDIARKYFEVLRYTPLQVVGVNLNSTITFDDSMEGKSFQELFLPQDSRILQIIGKNSVSASTVLRYPRADQGERITLTLEQPDNKNRKRGVNFNYEFDFTDWDSFGKKLAKMSEIADYCDAIVGQLLEPI